MATFSVLNLGLSGLNAYQKALETTAHNISNVNTPGFSRQEPVLSTRPAQFTGVGYSGGGVKLDTIRRAYDQHIVEQLRAQTSVTKELEVKNDLIARLENLFSDDSAGIGQAFQAFFESVAGAAEDPTSIAARQVMLSNMSNVVGRFREMQSRMDELHGDLEIQMKTTVSEVNSLAGTIADINSQLVANAHGGSAQPNDLLDQRDEAIRQLAERVDVSTVANDDGTINVMVGSGHTLVMRTDVNELAVTRNANDPNRVDVVVGSAKDISLSSTITGGEIGGLLNMQSGALDSAERGLGHVALAIADGFNRQHQLGMDLSGQIGGLLITDINDPVLQGARAINSGNNNGDAELVVTIDDVGALTDSDYRLDFDGTDYRLTRLSDGAVVTNFASFPQALPAEGITIDLGSGTAAAGDSFLISPTAGIAKQMEVQIDDPRAIALAAPVRALSALDNLGDARISQERVGDLVGLPLANDITLEFDASSNQFTVSGAPGGPLAYDPANESGKEFTLSPVGFGDIQFSLSGVPADGDRFTIESNQGGVGDNRNGLALGAVRLEKLLEGGTVSIEEGFGLMLADIGTRGRQLDMNFNAQSSMLSQVQAEQQAVSGVNLDEEAVNLMRFQQAYEASAKVIAVADELFNVLLRMAG